MRLKDIGEEITLDEGYIITIEDRKEFLLLRQIKNYYFAVEMIGEDEMSNNYYLLKKSIDSEGDVCIQVEERF